MKRIKTAILICTACLMLPALAQAQAPFTAVKEHGLLKKDVGTWDAAGKLYVPGMKDPIPFSGVEKNEMIGDLHVITDFQANLGGMPFRGHGRLSYNPESKKYEGSWFDSTNPYTSAMVGAFDEKTKTLKMDTTGKEGITGKVMNKMTTVEYKSDDHRVMTSYIKEGDKMVKEMEIVYKRKK